jgi:hypothetical protein
MDYGQSGNIKRRKPSGLIVPDCGMMLCLKNLSCKYKRATALKKPREG